MKKVLVVLAVAAMALPALAVVDYFPVMQNGNMDIRSGAGYSSSGAAFTGGRARLFKTKENVGWMSWVKNDGTKSVGDTSGLDLAAFVAANGGWNNVQVKLYFKTTDSTMPLATTNGGTTVKPCGAWIESIRTGNTGPIIEDKGDIDRAFGSDLVASGFQGASTPLAFRGGDPDSAINAMWQNGDFYNTVGTATPWKTPSGRVAGSGNGGGFGAGQNIVFPGGTYGESGWNGVSGGWAFNNLMGAWSNLGLGGNAYSLVNDPADPMYWGKSGQIIAKNADGTPLVVNQTNFASNAGATDPRKNNAGWWYGIPLDGAFVQDLFTNSENKGLAFVTDVSTLTPNNTNVRFYSMEYNSTFVPYLAVEVVPEPATLCLLALGGLALLRRRA